MDHSLPFHQHIGQRHRIRLSLCYLKVRCLPKINNMTLSWRCVGTRISVIAIYLSTSFPLAEVSVDLDGSTSNIVVISNSTDPQPIIQTIFESPILDSGNHAFQAQLLNNNGNFTLSSFSISGSNNSNGSTSSTVFPTGGSTSSQSQAPTLASSPSHPSHTNVGLIVGSCVGVAAFSVLVTVVVFVFLRRLKRRRISKSQQSTHDLSPLGSEQPEFLGNLSSGTSGSR